VISLAKLGSRRIISIYGPERGGSFMTALDTVTSLELERSVFDSDEARILSIAFEKAWITCNLIRRWVSWKGGNGNPSWRGVL
jgi:hypothetical protein